MIHRQYSGTTGHPANALRASELSDTTPNFRHGLRIFDFVSTCCFRNCARHAAAATGTAGSVPRRACLFTSTWGAAQSQRSAWQARVHGRLGGYPVEETSVNVSCYLLCFLHDVTRENLPGSTDERVLKVQQCTLTFAMAMQAAQALDVCSHCAFCADWAHRIRRSRSAGSRYLGSLPHALPLAQVKAVYMAFAAPSSFLTSCAGKTYRPTSPAGGLLCSRSCLRSNVLYDAGMLTKACIGFASRVADHLEYTQGKQGM